MDEIWDLSESVSEAFPTYSSTKNPSRDHFTYTSTFEKCISSKIKKCRGNSWVGITVEVLVIIFPRIGIATVVAHSVKLVSPNGKA